MKKIIIALGAAAMMATAFTSCEEESDTTPERDSRDTTSGGYVYNESKNMVEMYCKVFAGGKPAKFDKQQIWMKEWSDGKNTNSLIEIPKFNYNGITVPGFAINDVEAIGEKNFAKDYNEKDAEGGTHSGTIKYSSQDYLIKITMSEKYSGMNDELDFDFFPNMALMLAGTYAGQLTYGAKDMKDTTIQSSLEIAMGSKREVKVLLPEMEIAPAANGKDAIMAGPYSIDTEMNFGETEITFPGDTIKIEPADGKPGAKIVLDGSYSINSKLQVAFSVKQDETGLEVKGSFSNN